MNGEKRKSLGELYELCDYSSYDCSSYAEFTVFIKKYQFSTTFSNFNFSISIFDNFQRLKFLKKHIYVPYTGVFPGSTTTMSCRPTYVFFRKRNMGSTWSCPVAYLQKHGWPTMGSPASLLIRCNCCVKFLETGSRSS